MQQRKEGPRSWRFNSAMLRASKLSLFEHVHGESRDRGHSS
jgi:nitrate reductase assembly molybdenum cofactor insertion protein NarJ